MYGLLVAITLFRPSDPSQSAEFHSIYGRGIPAIIFVQGNLYFTTLISRLYISGTADVSIRNFQRK